MESVLTRDQKKVVTRMFGLDKPTRISVEIRYDDECGNGHNTFAITADVYEESRNGKWVWSGGGCQHELIAKHCPDLAKYIKWHLFDSTGPLHYVANTVYHAGDRDCNGKRDGEPLGFKKRIKVDGIPDGVDLNIPVHEYEYFLENRGDVPIHINEHGPDKSGYKFEPKYSLRVCKWYKSGFDSLAEAEGCLELFRSGKCSVVLTPTGYSKGKDRDLDAARSCAVWPEATDAELSVEPEELEKVLIARLPKLMAEFKADMEELGFTY